MSRQVQRLMKHGNCTAVTITRPMLFALNWVSGQGVIVELLEDLSGVLIRLPRQEDFGPLTPPRLVRSALQQQQATLDLGAASKRG